MSRFAALRARAGDAPLNPDPAIEDDEEDETNPEPEAGADKETEMTDKTKKEDQPVAAEPKADAIDHKARMQAVFANETVKGKERLAADILADAAFDSLTADAVIKLVGKSEAGAAPKKDDDAEFRDKAAAAMDAKIGDLGEGGGVVAVEDQARDLILFVGDQRFI